jgi:hypothetical protein
LLPSDLLRKSSFHIPSAPKGENAFTERNTKSSIEMQTVVTTVVFLVFHPKDLSERTFTLVAERNEFSMLGGTGTPVIE